MTRIEHDLIGDRDVPAHALWGIHTLRAVENFQITGRTIAEAGTIRARPPYHPVAIGVMAGGKSWRATK